MPTPTIVEAAQALYSNHNVNDITRSDAGARNLTKTTEAIKQIIRFSKENRRKSIVFVTGVPGAGKTLVGLNLASEFHNNAMEEHAIFLSGNLPLVTVLQEALARDKAELLKSFHDERDGTGANTVPLLGSGVSDVLLPEFYYADDS